LRGSNGAPALTGSAKAELDWLFKEFIDIGPSADYSFSESEGVLQIDVPKVINSSSLMHYRIQSDAGHDFDLV
jgi:hypothetical protein